MANQAVGQNWPSQPSFARELILAMASLGGTGFLFPSLRKQRWSKTGSDFSISYYLKVIYTNN
jgi:hypothetical protein